MANVRKQPNETVVYPFDWLTPAFVRQNYTVEGLTQGGVDPTEDAIIAIARAQDTTGDPFPQIGDTAFNLPMTRTTVSRYRPAKGNARIVVEFGDRAFSFGGGPDVKRERSTTVPGGVEQKYGVTFTGVGPSILEVRTRQVPRAIVRTTVSRLMDEQVANNLLDSTISTHVGDLMPWRGIDRVILGGNVSSVGQTQAYLSIILEYRGPVPEVAAGALFGSPQSPYQSLPVKALGLNEEYTDPDFQQGTLAIPASDVYGDSISTFPWMTN